MGENLMSGGPFSGMDIRKRWQYYCSGCRVLELAAFYNKAEISGDAGRENVNKFSQLKHCQNEKELVQ